jgi:spore germination cell wall hydrolase CwlJ-like protein
MPTPFPDRGRSLAQQSPDVLLAMLIFCEARFEPFIAKLSVGFVAVNRWNSGMFGETIKQVILSPDQFSCFDPSNPKHFSIYRPFDPALIEDWQVSFIAGIVAKLRVRRDPTDEALYFHDGTVSSPPAEWGCVEQTRKYGTLTFYRRSFAHSA